ncbi:AI-2E family transporter [Methanolobus sp. ZRKC2]|uniref:AI-2E family transporter n=1 Tax=Methanolobus sp. ZRKC2 TaxID=3125783 RepID=UPI0032496D4A
MRNNTFSGPATIFLAFIGIILVTLGMQAISSMIIPLIFSFFGALVFAPLVRWLQRKGVPNTVSVGLVVFFFILAIIFIGVLTVISIVQLNQQIPIYQTQLNNYIDGISQQVPSPEDFSISSLIRNITGSLIAVSLEIVTGAINATTAVAIIIITTAFLLLDTLGISAKTIKDAQENYVLLRNIGNFSKGLMDYVVIRTETNLITGAGVGIVLLLGGIEFAIFWAIVIFIFSYIPFIGLFLASIPPVFLALLQYGPVGALVVIAVILVVNILAENVIFPSLAGKGLELYPSVVFISLVYWAYVLGPAGALISTPLTMAVKVILESFEETKGLAMLLGSGKNQEEIEETEKADA